jgi:hypothetical protein
LIHILTEPEKRVIFLFVADAHAAKNWVQELRQRCKLPAESLLVFGEQPIARVDKARVVLYRHDQIKRRLGQHVRRFTEAGRQVTAVVDSCDLLDPAGIAMLLFDCDQFIGFTRHPSGHAQAFGGRMLDAFFEQQTIATYTFADAEQDGWLHSFDVIRQPVAFQKDELAHYNKLSDQFVALHGDIRRRYPELRRDGDFGLSLYQVLARNADHRAANLFTLREEREELAQMAQAKVDVVVRLVESAGMPAGCLVFDDRSLWSMVLCRRLTAQGKSVQVLPPPGDPDLQSVWKLFERKQLDCLILHNVPPADLSRACINRLILLTPLAPLTLLSDVTDWALSHAVPGFTVVGVDLLYTVDTPEQGMMMDFADTCCGLRLGRGSLGVSH